MASPGALAVSSPSSGMPSTARLPIVYQIDFTAVASGKRIASTKRRVRWRFGFANPEALANGETGVACRGEEHDITLVWSLTSGKRLVMADGQEVHYSNSRSGVLDFSWTMRGNHVLKVVAHASPPLSSTPGFRQYDFFVDGQSFFTFPKVFRLGLSPNARSPGSPGSPPELAQRSQPYNNYSVPPAQRSSSTNIVSIEAPHTADEEEAYLKEAIKLSLQDRPAGSASVVSGTSGPPAGPAEPNLLLDFFSEPPAAAPALLAAPAPAAPALPALPAPVPAPAAYPETTANGYGATPVPAPVNPPQAVAPQPTLNGISTEFAPSAAPAYSGAPGTDGQAPFALYSQQPVPTPGYAPTSAPAFASPTVASPAPAPAAPPVVPQFASPAPAFAPQVPDATSVPFFSQPVAEVAPAPTADPAALTMNSLSGQMGSLTDGAGTRGGSMADQAYMKIANLGDFDLVSKKESPRANPFDDSASSTIGGQASLADIKAKKQTTPKQDIMRAAPGAMVVSGTQQGNFGGYGQYGASPTSQPGQTFGQPPAYDTAQAGQGYGQAPAYGAQPQYGQAPAPPQPQYGQGPPPPMQQPQYGQPFQQQGFGAPTYQQGY